MSKKGADPIAHSQTTLVLKDHAINGVTDNPGKEQNKGVHHTLNECKCNHIAIRDVSNFVCHDRPNLIGFHALQ